MSLLKEHEVFPSKEVLQNALGGVYCILEELETRLTQDDFGFSFNWYFSTHIKSWSCKIYQNQKIIFSFLVEEGFFKIMFVFNEKHLEGFASLDISEQVKEKILRAKAVGKMLTLSINVKQKEQLADLYKICKYKTTIDCNRF